MPMGRWRAAFTDVHLPDVPKIVVLCGSTRFRREFEQANREETLAGNIVLSVGFFARGGCTAGQKMALDELHKRMIDLADEVLVLNVGGYVGESTRSVIEYAHGLGVPVRHLEPPG